MSVQSNCVFVCPVQTGCGNSAAPRDCRQYASNRPFVQWKNCAIFACYSLEAAVVGALLAVTKI